MDVTLQLPEELAGKVHAFKDSLPEILELGLRSWRSNQCAEFAGLSEILEKLAALPSPQEVLDLRPSSTLQTRLDTLQQKSKNEGLTPKEEQEWQCYSFIEHLVRMAKTKAAVKLKAS